MNTMTAFEQLMRDPQMPNSVKLEMNTAHKFSLDAELVSLVKWERSRDITPYFRLPYPKCWFDFTNAKALKGLLCYDAPSGAEFEELHNDSGHTLKVRRIDVQLYGEDQDGSEHCWMTKKLSMVLAEDGTFAASGFKNLTSADFMEGMRGVFQMLGGTLLLLNCRNIRHVAQSSAPAPNTKRGRRLNSQLPPYEFKTLILPGFDRKEYLSTSPHEKIRMRAHMVRGHFKIRKSGIYWWAPFVRGDAQVGIIHKDYIMQ